ncbi:hypothetical protein BKA82DRAFT_4185089, partial [Pisolithus tinctorius]
MIDIEMCPGCCTGPRQRADTLLVREPWLPSTYACDGSHELELDGRLAKFDECSGQEIALGDYGDFTRGNFKYCGNIFKDVRQHGGDSVYSPVESRVSSCEDVVRRVQTRHDLMTRGIECDNLAVHEPKCLSLPNNKEFQLLLKALHLEDRALVTTVIQCLDFYKVDDKGRRIDMGCHSASKGDEQSAVPITFKVPLCIIVRRLFWGRNPACAREGNFLKILEKPFTPWKICITLQEPKPVTSLRCVGQLR